MPTGGVVTHHAMEAERSQGKITDVLNLSLSPANFVTSDKSNFYGIEVREKLIWKDWEQGKEYIKTLLLKNLGLKTQKLKYKNPSTRFFTTLYPKPIFLSAGSSFTLPITFRPIENIEYKDKIVFFLKDGATFEVSLLAILPQIDICLPINLDFKMCAVNDTIFIMFDVFNTGDLDTQLKWEVSDPFEVVPVEEELKHNSSLRFRATFKPTAAFVYEAVAVCRFGKDLQLIGKTVFYGVGKYPHLMVCHPMKTVDTEQLSKQIVAETEINFGKIAVALTGQLFIELHNLSQVQTPFRVERVPGMNHLNTVFRCLQTRGVVPAMSLVKIPIVYSPHTVGVTSIDYFTVCSVGHFSRSSIKCVGTAVGPCVELSRYFITFTDVDLGGSAVALFDIINNSDVEAMFQFELDCEESVFQFSLVSGSIKANSRENVQLRFVPQHPINYYRRVAFLVHNQQLNELLQSGRLQVDSNGCLDIILAEDKATLRSNPNPRDIQSVDEYFNDGFHCDLINILPHVSLDVHVLDFGNVQNLNFPMERTVKITNHTKGKVTAQWMGDASHVFSVSPGTLDIPALKSCSFRVSFKAEAANKMYGSELECFVCYKSMRDYKLVEDLTLCPPWCLTLKCLGHTFMPNNDTFLPRAVIDPLVVVFPAVNTGESTHQTLLLANAGDTPILYDLTLSFTGQDQVKARCGTSSTPQKDLFMVKPSKGLLKPGCQVLSLRMTPNAISTFSHDLLIRLNDREKYDQVVHLCGSAECAQVILDNEGYMYVKPTCAGTSSSRSYSFKNISRIPLRFQWKLSKEYEKFLTVQPSTGVVQPNELVSQTWTFTPAEKKKYVLKATLMAWGQGLSFPSSGSKKQTFSLHIIGEGSYGDLQSDQSCLDFGDILVGSSASCPINILNNSNCSLHYRLIIDKHGYQTTTPTDVKRYSTVADNPGVEFDPMSAEVPARGKHSILATIRPTRRMQYRFAVSYQLVTAQDKEAHPAVLEPQHLIQLLASGVYPSMTAVDIHGRGSAIGISKKSLWRLFSLTDVNGYLDSEPSSNEFIPSTITSTSFQAAQPVLVHRTVIDFNFSAAPLGSEPCTITIMFHNDRTVLCEWAFLFSKDMQMEMGNWTESGDCAQEQLHEMKVKDNKLFEVSPKNGALKPGDSASVTFTYLHTMPGTNQMPVILKIFRGREIMLNFVGVTVEASRPYIHFPSSKHMFNPISIGEKFSPKQVYELYNGGAIPVSFETDLRPLAAVKQENFNQDIFECLTPSGSILPGQTATMEWRFSPLEAKMYTVDIPIKVQNGDTAIVTFTGVGYDQRDLGDTMLLSDGSAACGVPSLQKEELPGQLGYLSMERISLGNLPMFSIVRRMVFVTNKSQDRSIFFEWHVTSQRDSKFIHIYPMRGKLGPDDFKMCRVTFFATAGPAFYDLDLVCEISDLFEYTNYRRELAAWQAERERQISQFVITEKDLDADMRTPNVVTVVTGTPSRQVSKLEALADGRSVTSDNDLSKYQTLPPIRQLTADEQHLRDLKRKKKLSQFWVKPQPQKPFLLHLGITARTHNHDTFQMHFSDELNHFYIDPTLSKENSLLEPYEQASGPPTYIQSTLDESKLVASVLGVCLRGLLDDAHFIEAIRKVQEEPVPYFCQLTEKTPAGSTDNMGPQKTEEDHSGDDGENPLSVSGTSDAFISKLENVVEEQDGLMSVRAFSSQASDHGTLDRVVSNQRLTQAMKRLPEFGHLVEQILENTIINLMYEATTTELGVISTPRLVAMSRRRLSNMSASSEVLDISKSMLK
ncbi:hypothetical protein BsWGS_25049 [Bradybaena similaris]